MSIGRIDGLVKVTGGKLYASDIWPRDCQNWPNSVQFAYLVKATFIDRIFAGLDPEALNWLNANGFEFQSIITAADLNAKKVASPGGRVQVGEWTDDPEKQEQGIFGRNWLVPKNRIPEFIGQPVAILYFHNWYKARAFAGWFRRTNGIIDDTTSLIQVGAKVATPEEDVRRLANKLLGNTELNRKGKLYAETHLIKYFDDDQNWFSYQTGQKATAISGCDAPATGGDHNPFKPVVLKPDGTVDKASSCRNRAARQAETAIVNYIEDNNLQSLRRTFSTQTVDTMFMETEGGLAWFDQQSGRLELHYGTQSPRKDRDNIQTLFVTSKGDEVRSDFYGTNIEYHPHYPGGGFGGRDNSNFPIYLALAALFSDKPVRLAYDRYEQFLCGIKRHASVTDATISWKDDDGTLYAVQTSTLMDGGGQPNLTAPVVGLCALHSTGSYRFKANAIHVYGVQTDGAVAGSMRGFGIPQAAFMIESMIDELSNLRNEDPIDFRLRSIVRVGHTDAEGYAQSNHLASQAVCNLAKVHPLWLNRESEKKKRDTANVSYGVGFACCIEAFGTSRDGVFAAITMDGEGQLIVHSSAVDMGQGSAESVRIATAPSLGCVATRVNLGAVELFDSLKMTDATSALRYDDPKWTPKLDNSMSASITAFLHVHAVEQASQVLFQNFLRPLAYKRWGVTEGEAQWSNGQLLLEGKEPLELADLAKDLYTSDEPHSVMVHVSFVGAFTEGAFEINAQPLQQLPIDGLAIKRPSETAYTCIERAKTFPPPLDALKNAVVPKRTVYAAAGHLIGVEVHKKTGAIKVTDAVTLLDAGDVHHEQLLRGQVEGGLAMGLGMAISEYLPPAPQGVNGAWNLDKYIVMRAYDMPKNMELVLVPLDTPSILSSNQSARKKGIAEATATTVPPAVANAVAHAIGKHINSLPISPDKIMQVLND